MCTQLCLILCDPMGCSPLGFSVRAIFQARILEWVAISLSRGSYWPRDRTLVSFIAGRFFTIWATREALLRCHMYPDSFNPHADYNLHFALFRCRNWGLKWLGQGSICQGWCLNHRRFQNSGISNNNRTHGHNRPSLSCRCRTAWHPMPHRTGFIPACSLIIQSSLLRNLQAVVTPAGLLPKAQESWSKRDLSNPDTVDIWDKPFYREMAAWPPRTNFITSSLPVQSIWS